MGVYGLWKLLQASGKPVPLESLEGKVLAIDISIWIYQVLQGYQDRHGTPRPNAHLLGLFTRICKLLYYKIKPIFVFDGGVPMLKKNTIASRRKQKSIATSKAQKMKADLMNNLIRHRVVKTVLNKDHKNQNGEATQIMINMQTKRSNEDMFALPDMPSISNLQSYVDDEQHNSDTLVELSPRKQSKWMGNIHNVDVTSSEFKALPADVRYDILTDLKETRKQNSWGRLHEMPQESQEFSGFQLKRLLKRRHVQASLESAEKEMGGKTLTLEELDKLLTEQGIDTKSRDTAFRIAADSTTRLIYISDKSALAKKSVANESEKDKSDALQIADEQVEPVAGPSNPMPIVKNINEYGLNESDSETDLPIYDDALSLAENVNEYTFDSDWESENDINESLALLAKNMTNPALTYMLEYSGLSQNQIMQLIKFNKDENHQTVNNGIKAVAREDTSTELAKVTKPIDDKSMLTFPENSKQVLKSVEIQSMKDARMLKKNITDELISSSSESGNLTQVKLLKNNAKISNASNISSSNEGVRFDKRFPAVKTNNVTQIETSDSDSDDFIEIQDVPIHDMNISRNITKKKDIEVTFKSDKNLENDIFVDIFEKMNKEEVVPMIPEQEQFVNMINGEHQIQLISKNNNNLKDSFLNTAFEESIERNTKTELPENIQLSKNISNDEDKIYNTEKSIEQDNTDTPTRVNSLHEYVQEKPKVLPINEEDLRELKEQLEDEQEELARGIGKLERQATNISEQITTDAQELLRLFGIPYIIAPMEAEAQCAYLEQIKLTDGTITDDSDIWLFGGQCVYKNFFNHNKKMLQFRACDIQHHFKLSRNQLIQLALLVGSDYTTGVAGVGPVTALEILAAFPADGDNVLHGLHNFCSWIKKGMVTAPEKRGLRNKLRNMRLDRDFPNQAVVQAYLFPTVDESKETFTWGKPNFVLLCDYTRQKFGWTKGKFDDTMIPVLRRMKENKNQKLLDMYFKAKTSPHSIEPSLSKRVQKALRSLNSDDVDTDGNVDDKLRLKKSKKDDAIQKSSKEKNSELEPTEFEVSTHKSKRPIKISTIPERSVKTVKNEYTKEYIPQREKNKACALERKLHAIEIFRKSKQGLDKSRKVKCKVRKIKKQAELSESDSN